MCRVDAGEIRDNVALYDGRRIEKYIFAGEEVIRTVIEETLYVIRNKLLRNIFFTRYDDSLNGETR